MSGHKEARRASAGWHGYARGHGGNDHQLTALRGKRGLDVLRSLPAEPIPMLDHNPLHRRITQQRKELAAVTVQRRPDLDYNFVHRELLSRGPSGHPRDLPIQIRLLTGRRHPRIHRCPQARITVPTRLANENQPAHFPGRSPLSA